MEYIAGTQLAILMNMNLATSWIGNRESSTVGGPATTHQ